MLSQCEYMIPNRHGSEQAWLIQADCTVAQNVTARPWRVGPLQDCFYMHESQGMLAMHPCAASSLNQLLERNAKHL